MGIPLSRGVEHPAGRYQWARRAGIYQSDPRPAARQLTTISGSGNLTRRPRCDRQPAPFARLLFVQRRRATYRLSGPDTYGGGDLSTFSGKISRKILTKSVVQSFRARSQRKGMGLVGSRTA